MAADVLAIRVLSSAKPQGLTVFRHSIDAWEDTAAFYEELVDQHHLDFVQPALAIVRSVIAEGAADQLAAHTSMHDLVVTAVPVSEKPDWIRVAPAAETVVIRHASDLTGPGDEIERPTSEALPLFWRFVIEKFGIHPARDLA